MSKIKIKSPEGFNMSKREWCLCGILIPAMFCVAVILRVFLNEKYALEFLKNNNIIN